jgi:hypothetical protein
MLVPHRQRRLLYRAPTRTVALLVSVVVAVTAAAVLTGYFLAGAVIVGVTVLAWLAFALRVSRRLAPAGPPGDGPTPPGGAGVREPRRPLPLTPAGAAAMPLPEEEPPGQAVALG